MKRNYKDIMYRLGYEVVYTKLDGRLRNDKVYKITGMRSSNKKISKSGIEYYGEISIDYGVDFYMENDFIPLHIYNVDISELTDLLK